MKLDVLAGTGPAGRPEASERARYGLLVGIANRFAKSVADPTDLPVLIGDVWR